MLLLLLLLKQEEEEEEEEEKRKEEEKEWRGAGEWREEAEEEKKEKRTNEITTKNERKWNILDKDFFHGGDGRPEAVDAEFGAVLLECVEQLLEDGAALVWQQIVQLGAYTRLLPHVRYVVTNDTRDVLLSAAAVLYQRQVITDPCVHVFWTFGHSGAQGAQKSKTKNGRLALKRRRILNTSSSVAILRTVS